jgi:hypothetical protein
MAKAYASTIVNAPAEAVWARIRDFNGLPGWHPGIDRSRIEEGKRSDEVGCVRDFYLKDGAHIREKLLGFSDLERSQTYNFQLTPFPVQNYVATLKVTPVTDGNRSFVEWSATFDVAPDQIGQWQDTFANGVFQGGFDALKKHFGG